MREADETGRRDFHFSLLVLEQTTASKGRNGEARGGPPAGTWVGDESAAGNLGYILKATLTRFAGGRSLGCALKKSRPSQIGDVRPEELQARSWRR